jgi:hypothetical protein
MSPFALALALRLLPAVTADQRTYDAWAYQTLLIKVPELRIQR